MMQEGLANFYYQDSKFDIIKFTGTESLSSPFEFVVEIDAPFTTEFDVHEPHLVTIELKTEQLNIRRWQGVIDDIIERPGRTKNNLKLTIRHPIANLKQHTPPEQFYYEDPFTIVRQLLMRHNVLSTKIDIDRHFGERRALFHKSEQITDFDYVHHLLNDIGLHYYFASPDSLLHFFHQPHSLARSTYGSVQYFSRQQAPSLINQPYFDGMKFSKECLTIDTPLRALVVGEQIKAIVPPCESFGGDFIIGAIEHSYQRDCDNLYRAKAKLVRTIEHPFHHIPNPIEHQWLMAKVLGDDAQRASLNKNGHYRYQIENMPQQDFEQYRQPPIPYLAPFAGSGHKGFHYPLHPDSQVMLGFCDGAATEPLIVSSFFEQQQHKLSLLSSDSCNHFKLANGVHWTMQDKLNENSIELFANQCGLKLDAKHNAQKFLLKSAGNFEIDARSDILYQVGAYHLSIGKDCHHTIEKDVLHHTDDSLYTICDTYQVDTKNLEFLADDLIQLQSENFEIASAKQTALHAKEGDIMIDCRQATGVIEGIDINLLSAQHITIGSPNAYICLDKDNIELHANSLHINSQAAIKVNGPIVHNSHGHSARMHDALYPPHLMKHMQPGNLTRFRVQGLQWQNSVQQAGLSIKALFQIRGYRRGDSGVVRIFRCAHQHVNEIQPNAIDYQDRKEQLTQVAELPFTLGDERYYSLPHEVVNSPGDATIHIWTLLFCK
jgi:hypothetical protein